MGLNVVMFSGGIGSWATAKRVAERHGTDGLVLLFADTKVEDEDTYRFLREAAVNVGGELVEVADGRTPFEVFHDDRFLGNSRLANCSKYLKQKPCREWLDANAEPGSAVFVGIDWTEIHRMPAIHKGWLPYRAMAPMCDKPFVDKAQMLAWCEREGLKPPRSYAESFPHSNCLNQGCVRGGQGYWQLMLRIRPEAYRNTELEEERLRLDLGKDVAMLRTRDRAEVLTYLGWSASDLTTRVEVEELEEPSEPGGVLLKERLVVVHRETGQELPASAPLTLREFRERLEAQPELDFGMEGEACGCFTEDTTETPKLAA